MSEVSAEKCQAKLVLHHDDTPCEARLREDGLCIECGFVPDMQSTCFHYYCPDCDVEVKMDLMSGTAKCSKCGQTLVRPES